MAYVVAATYRVKPGEEEEVAAALRKMTEPSRREPGCLTYQVHRARDDARVFLIYEEYVDEVAYSAHQMSEHFNVHIKQEAIPRLESRDRAFYETLD